MYELRTVENVEDPKIEDNVYVLYLDHEYRHMTSLVEKIEHDLNKSLNDIKEEDSSKLLELLYNLNYIEQLYMIEYILEYHYSGQYPNQTEKELVYEKILASKYFDEKRKVIFGILSICDELSKEYYGTPYEKQYIEFQELLEKVETCQLCKFYYRKD
jgi:hypothetical protein